MFYQINYNGKWLKAEIASESYGDEIDTLRGIECFVLFDMVFSSPEITFNKSLQAAYDAFADSGMLDAHKLSEDEIEDDIEQYGRVTDAIPAGNESDYFDTEYYIIEELPADKVRKVYKQSELRDAVVEYLQLQEKHTTDIFQPWETQIIVHEIYKGELTVYQVKLEKVESNGYVIKGSKEQE